MARRGARLLTRSPARRRYTPKDKLAKLDLLDEIYDDKSISNKGQYFEADPRNTKPWVAYSTAQKWMAPKERRKISVACAQAHASSLLRIDTNSRRKGKFAAMETELMRLFKARRARARKCSPR